ncbi:MAG TPA: sigma factor-like helix-turn-helix DNA-binding protein [Bryobacteraceae bacterium]|nr:sigma factor-like helix-turn-helix DNA-binding protein [Bryobacteraceae bacterium]
MEHQRDLVAHIESRVSDPSLGDEAIEDDRLRLTFTCCHPALPRREGQVVALTLREICGLTTEEIARAFLVTPATLAQRLVRSNAKIREESIPYEVPTPQELPERRRLCRTTEARSSDEKALALTQQQPERQFLQERIRQLK